MPRNAAPYSSLLSTLKQQAKKALASLQREITRRERELMALQGEVSRWESILSGQSHLGRTSTGARAGRKSRGTRLDWNVVLNKLPSSFSVKQVAEETGKPIQQAYAGVARWVTDKKVKKGKDGYQKVGAANSSSTREKMA
jgi:hypothetical protein